MRLLLDTHILLSHLRDELTQDYPFAAPLLASSDAQIAVSVASIWEIAIKSRLGKLDCPVDPEDLERFLTEAGFVVLPITANHATAELNIDVPTRDPFDRLLIATAQQEGMRFVTADTALADHPVTFRQRRARSVVKQVARP
jgi:PIN domain nuclease of toxin-antitoxin system